MPALASAQYLREHYVSGGILIDDTNPQVIFEAQIPVRDYVGAFSGDLWSEAIMSPTDHVKWVVIRPNDSADRVGAVLRDSSSFQRQYALLFSDNSYSIYRLIEQ